MKRILLSIAATLACVLLVMGQSVVTPVAGQLNVSNTWSALQTFSGGATLTAPTLTGLTNGTGLQVFNTATTCTTAATISTPCTTASISLPVGYSDTNYRLSVSCLGVTAFPQVQTYTKSNTSFTITLNNLTAAAATCSSFDIVAAHN